MSDATLASLMPVAVIAPITGAILAPLAARMHRRAPLVISLFALAGALAVLLLIAPSVYRGHDLSHYMGNVTPFGGHALGIAFAADPLGLTFALAAAAIGSLLLLFTLSVAPRTGPRELGGYACLFQLLLAALIGSALTADPSTCSCGSRSPRSPATGSPDSSSNGRSPSRPRSRYSS